MNISKFLSSLIYSSNNDKFIYKADFNGLHYTLDQNKFNLCEQNEGSGWMLHQYVCFQTLVEQGYAEKLSNGFFIPSENIVQLDKDSQTLLDLPPHFKGEYLTKVTGLTSENRFSVQIIPVSSSGDKIVFYDVKGPLLQVTKTETYLLSTAEFIAFQALVIHQTTPFSKKTEHVNLKLIGELQRAKQNNMNIDLTHFNQLKVYQPEKISVSASEMNDGSLLLTPSFGTGASPVDIHNRLGQVTEHEKNATLRVGDQIILLNEERLKATDEIISNRKIPKQQVKAFLESPSAFLDAALVDLDTGFSIRVKGATEFTYLNMGETDALEMDWFSTGEGIVKPEQLESLITTQDDLEHFSELFEKAKAIGSREIIFSGKRIDISNHDVIESVIDKIILNLSDENKEDEDIEVPNEIEKSDDTRSTIVIDEIEANNKKLLNQADSLETKEFINYDCYLRQPFPHQKKGIEWILSLTHEAIKNKNTQDSNKIRGGLLADDMGLGKTFMALVSVSEIYKKFEKEGETCKPTLIVAPLSLLENWEDEVQKTFSESPFNDVVILQSARDLKQFKIEGAGNETRQNIVDGEVLELDAIKYSLKTGMIYGPERLDMPKRLVLITYQALRDYQFSLCRIDWGYVIFDEAQNIKNPNILQTRAAKGLKADFKLLATGTPVENNLGDFWCLMDTAQPGLLGNWMFFRDKYIKPINKANAKELSEVRNKVGKQLRDNVGKFMLRRLKEDNLDGLPDKYIFTGLEPYGSSEYKFMSELSGVMIDEQLSQYNKAIDDYSIQDKSTAALAILIKLRELSLHPSLGEEDNLFSENKKQAKNFIKQSTKLQILCKLLDDVKERNEKVIIFLMNKKLQRLVKIWLEQIYKINISIINGDTKAVSNNNSAETRIGLIRTFESQDGFAVIIMSPIAAGVGLTVTGANNVIHLERHWNPAKEAQATDRVYRIGQKKNVNVYLPLAIHPDAISFDVNLDRLLNQKTSLKDAVVSPQIVSANDMKAIF